MAGKERQASGEAGNPAGAKPTRAVARGLAVAGVLLAGAVGGFAVARMSSSPPPPAPASVPALDLPGDAAPPPAQAQGAPLPAADAPDATAAIQGFLDAEVAGDYARSWTYLSAGDQEELGPLAKWERDHVDYPPLERYELVELRERDGRVEAVTDVDLRSELNEFVGLVPARARATWLLERDAGNWRVVFTGSALEPRYPDIEGASAAALEWSKARQRCDEAPSRYDGPLLGVPALADALCGADGNVEAGVATGLEQDADAEPFVSAFGPQVYAWAAVVPIGGPSPFRAVLAPVDDEWVVIGVLRP